MYFCSAHICVLTFSEFKLNLLPLHLKQNKFRNCYNVMHQLHNSKYFSVSTEFFSIHIILIINIRKIFKYLITNYQETRNTKNCLIALSDLNILTISSFQELYCHLMAIKAYRIFLQSVYTSEVDCSTLESDISCVTSNHCEQSADIRYY